MKASYRRRINASALLCALVICRFALFVSPQEAKFNLQLADNNPKTLFLELRPSREDKIGNERFKVFIINKGPKKVTLLGPVDGSSSGFGSSIIAWSAIRGPWGKHPRKLTLNLVPVCGNFTPAGPKDVFELAPGQSHEFSRWLFSPQFDKPGLYRVRFYYDYVPSLARYDSSMRPHNIKAMQRAQQGTPCSLISNELVFTVLKSKRAERVADVEDELS